jgi:hypothetical protein
MPQKKACLAAQDVNEKTERGVAIVDTPQPISIGNWTVWALPTLRFEARRRERVVSDPGQPSLSLNEKLKRSAP